MMQFKCLRSTVIELDKVQILALVLTVYVNLENSLTLYYSTFILQNKILTFTLQVIVKFIFITPQILTQNVRFGCSKFLVSI